MGTERQHLHHDDHPATIGLVESVIHGRPLPGVEPTDAGVWINWDEVAASYLSSTEKATMQVARGLAVLERHGGSNGVINVALVDAVASICTDQRQPAVSR